ncbi:Hypothetical protein NTJ_04206 [Nesidiocoris tenuis]|uniref:Uncharacterized protein n=1 Tax=Nesidiocoris tenuis TaxID=355587 RepID=A0ABN7AH82_9HEMI|nr:Hypothetical protein NTJ_04206 [Nesidiocoris tenuis]
MRPISLQQLFQVVLVAAVAESSERLLKIPRVYNALITSNEDLLPSKAYPAVAPVIHHVPPGTPFLPAHQIEYRQELPQQKVSQSPEVLQPAGPTPYAELPLEDASEGDIRNYEPINPNIPDVPPPPIPIRVGRARVSRQDSPKMSPAKQQNTNHK